jgi:drug/metabolite transporter (DMT)-like permease
LSSIVDIDAPSRHFRLVLMATFCGMLGVSLWATETALITHTTRIPPLQTVSLAFFFATLVTPLAWLATGESPMCAFKQPIRIWFWSLLSLTGYHACIYYATQKAPPTPAALLQGTTPLVIVFGSAIVLKQRLRWSHAIGAFLGFFGLLLLIDGGARLESPGTNTLFHLSLIGLAAGLWGLYAIFSRGNAEVPTSTLGVFYLGCGFLTLLLHFSFEVWIWPNRDEILAIIALGLFPMGLAIFLWDFGVKAGDLRVLGVFSYVESLLGALIVYLIADGSLSANLWLSGVCIVVGSLVASTELWSKRVGSKSRNV